MGRPSAHLSVAAILALLAGAPSCLDTSMKIQVEDAGADVADRVLPDVRQEADRTPDDGPDDTGKEVDAEAETDADALDRGDGELPCLPACAGKECGSDGCGGQCGTCKDDGLACTTDKCEADKCVHELDEFFCAIEKGGKKTCVPADAGDPANPCKRCKPSESASSWTVMPSGTDCGGGKVCYLGQCCDKPAHCQGEDGKKECGDDGCGGTCGTCGGAQYACKDGKCVCVPSCEGKECGGDGCAGLCGECKEPNTTCKQGLCDCVDAECAEVCCDPGQKCNGKGACCTPKCENKECGDDGCDGQCGTCSGGKQCFYSSCLPTICDDGNAVSWDGCTAGQITEFQVNTTTASLQQNPAVATDAQGRFFIAWQSFSQDALWTNGIYATAFSAAGKATSGEFLVNQKTGGEQTLPAALFSGGDNVLVAYSSAGLDGAGYGIGARRFKPDGAAVENEYVANEIVTGTQTSPALASLGQNAWILLWESDTGDGNGYGIVGRRFKEGGKPDGAEFPLCVTEAGDQRYPDVAALSGGGFAAAWQSLGQDGSLWGVFGRVFAADGQPVSGDFQVNSYADWNQEEAAVAALSGGGFVAVWTSPFPGEDGKSIRAQRFDAKGVEVGSEFQVNTTGKSDQQSPDVAPLPGGGFVAVWQSYGQDYSGHGLYFQRFDEEGAKTGAETLANFFVIGDQTTPAAASFSDGTFVIAWQSKAQDGSDWGIYTQRFNAAGERIYH